MLSWRPPGSPGVVRYRQGPGQQEPQSHVQPGTMRANVPIRDGTPDSPGQQTLRQPRQTRGQRVIVTPGGGLDTGTGPGLARLELLARTGSHLALDLINAPAGQRPPGGLGPDLKS